MILWPWHALVLVTSFARDLVVSSLQVAKAVLSPRDICQPRFVTVPLAEARSDLEITLVANYITLTPGTLTVDVSPDRSTLLVHALLAGETGDDVRADIRQCIEPRVVRVTRPMIIASVQTGVLGAALAVAALCLIVALLAAAWRLLTGPTLADRVVALDLVSMLLVVFLVLFRMLSGVGAYIYVAIALALVSFLGTVAFAHYIDRTTGDSDE